MQSSSQIITTNKPTSSFFTGRMPFLSPNQQCQSTEGKISHSMDLLTPSLPVVFQLCLWPLRAPGYLGRVAMPFISPLMPVPLHCIAHCIWEGWTRLSPSSYRGIVCVLSCRSIRWTWTILPAVQQHFVPTATSGSSFGLSSLAPVCWVVPRAAKRKKKLLLPEYSVASPWIAVFRHTESIS